MRSTNSKIYGKFYSPEHLLSYGKHFMVSVGSRSIGKSTGWAIFLLKNFIKNKQQFIYIRRTEDELMLTCRSFFNNAVEILKEDKNSGLVDFKYDNRKYFIKTDDNPDWQYCGYCIPLSLCDKYKSNAEGVFWYCIYDEFISREGKYNGSKNNILTEWNSILSLYQTFDRCKGKAYRNELKMVFLGNAYSFYNPIMLGLGITDYVRVDSKMISPKDAEWVFENTSQVEATAEYEKSVAYKVSDEASRLANFSNITWDNHSFCEKIKDPVKPLYNLSYNSSTYGVYWCEDRGCIYICNKKNLAQTMALTPKNQDRISYTLVARYSDCDAMKFLREAYRNGDIIFENYKIKYDIANYFALTL